jgi:hypothetical protein
MVLPVLKEIEMILVILNNGNGEMQVGKDGAFYDHLDASQLPNDVHAVQWNGTSGEVEKKDPATGKMTTNEEISDISAFQFAVDAWQSAYDAEQAEIALAIAEAEAAQQPE